jgi:hypothetical protein
MLLQILRCGLQSLSLLGTLYIVTEILETL